MYEIAIDPSIFFHVSDDSSEQEDVVSHALSAHNMSVTIAAPYAGNTCSAGFRQYTDPSLAWGKL